MTNLAPFPNEGQAVGSEQLLKHGDVASQVERDQLDVELPDGSENPTHSHHSNMSAPGAKESPGASPTRSVGAWGLGVRTDRVELGG